MRIPKPFVDRIRILLRVNIPMMGAVIPAPPPGTTLKSSGSPSEQNEFNGPARGVSLVTPKAMVARGNARSRQYVLDNGEPKGGAAERDEEDTDDEADERGEDDGSGEPVDALEKGEFGQLLVGHVLG